MYGPFVLCERMKLLMYSRANRITVKQTTNVFLKDDSAINFSSGFQFKVFTFSQFLLVFVACSVIILVYVIKMFACLIFLLDSKFFCAISVLSNHFMFLWVYLVTV